MNKKILELMPKKQGSLCYGNGEIAIEKRLSYNQGIDECTAALEKHEVGIVPSEEMIAEAIWEEETMQGSFNRPSWKEARPYQKGIYYKFAKAIRALMLGEEGE